MPFKLQNNRMIEVKHETVFGRCVEVSALSYKRHPLAQKIFECLAIPIYDCELKPKKKGTVIFFFKGKRKAHK